MRVPREEVNFPSPIVLDPYAPTPLSRRDREIARRGGLLAVDCSWNRLHARGAFPGVAPGPRPPPNHRRLPLLIATNPHHYGRVAELNTVEAFSAALYILGRPGEAERLMEGFRGGSEFLKVNRARLDLYRAAPSSLAISDAERTLFGGA